MQTLVSENGIATIEGIVKEYSPAEHARIIDAINRNAEVLEDLVSGKKAEVDISNIPDFEQAKKAAALISKYCLKHPCHECGFLRKSEDRLIGECVLVATTPFGWKKRI